MVSLTDAFVKSLVECKAEKRYVADMFAIFLDLETTGLDPKKHRVIDIGMVCVDITNSQICAKYQSLIAIESMEWEKSDPNSLAINGYSWEELQGGRPVGLIADEIEALFARQGIIRGKAVFICQNPSFDRAFFTQIVDTYRQEELRWPYHWLDLASMFWALEVKRLQQLGEPMAQTLSLSKNEIAGRYGLAPEPAVHRAMNGVVHLLETYQKLLNIFFIEKTDL